MTILKVGQTIKNIINAINDNFSELDGRKTYKVLYNGSVDIPAYDDGTSVTINLLDSLANYDAIILQLEDCDAYHHFGNLTTGTVFKPIHNQMDFTAAMSGWNMFGYNCEILNNTQLKLDKFVYSGSSFDKNQYLDIYDLRYMTKYSVYPLTKVIGVKFN